MERWFKKINETNVRADVRLSKLGLFLLFLPTAVAQQSSPKTTGNNNQTAGTNNGIMIQLNVRATPDVEKSLKGAAKKELGDEQGWLRILTPAQDPTPPNSCGPVPNHAKSLTVILGGGAIGACDLDHCGILRDADPNAETTELLSVQRKGMALVVSGVVFDDEGKIVVALKDNQPHVNKNNAFEWTRPDTHTLDVVNQKNQRVLHVRLLNRTTVYIEGLFYNSRGVKVQIGKDRLVLTNPKTNFKIDIHNNCSFDAGRAVYSF
jgi:hypothetical protein